MLFEMISVWIISRQIYSGSYQDKSIIYKIVSMFLVTYSLVRRFSDKLNKFILDAYKTGYFSRLYH